MKSILILIIGAVLFLILLVPDSRAEMAGENVNASASSPEDASAPAEVTRVENSYLIHRIGSGESLPLNVTIIATGEIVNVDRDQDMVSVRDPQTGRISLFPVSDRNALKDLTLGDKVQVFSLAARSH